jgi:ankyrin repeat protein
MTEALGNPEIKALVNSRDQDGGTILFTAATKGSPEIVKLLLDAGTCTTIFISFITCGSCMVWYGMV